jgi:hypothetical protein
MLKTILLGGAMLLAIPALAQTTGTAGSQDSGTATTTNDHDPTVEEDDVVEGTTTTVTTQVDGGVNSSAGVATAADQPGTMNDKPMHDGVATSHSDTGAGRTAEGATSHGTMNHGTATTGTATSHGTMNHGTATGTTGVGGPYTAAKSYPPCSRTVTDSCIQTYERGRRR